MRGKKHSKYKLNNQGMSLIEVMVAVVILALVTGPLLHSFVTAAKFNVRSKERQRITSAAQSIMEGFKAYNIDQIAYQFNGLSDFNVYTGMVGSVWEEPMEDRDGDGSFDTYIFCMQNITFEGALYDARVRVTPNAGTVSTTTLAAPPQMNDYLDAVYKQSSYDDGLAYTNILDRVLVELISHEEYYSEYTLDDLETEKIKIHKITNVNITKDPTNADINFVRIDTVYDYEVEDHPFYRADGTPDTFDLSDSYTASPITIYDNTATVGNGAKLENIYLYYYPAYKNNYTGIRIDKETIKINNTTGIEKNIFLIKQLNKALTPAELNTCENSYNPRIIESGDGIQLYHNLYSNLSDPGGTYGTVDMNVVHEHSDILPMESKVLVYDVQVSVYEQGAAAMGFAGAPLLALDGSMNDD